MNEIVSSHGVIIRPDSGYFKRLSLDDLEEVIKVNSRQMLIARIQQETAEVSDLARRMNNRYEWLLARRNAMYAEIYDRQPSEPARATSNPLRESVVASLKRLVGVQNG